jgi:hypothetical protein
MLELGNISCSYLAYSKATAWVKVTLSYGIHFAVGLLSKKLYQVVDHNQLDKGVFKHLKNYISHLVEGSELY